MAAWLTLSHLFNRHPALYEIVYLRLYIHFFARTLVISNSRHRERFISHSQWLTLTLPWLVLFDWPSQTWVDDNTVLDIPRSCNPLYISSYSTVCNIVRSYSLHALFNLSSRSVFLAALSITSSHAYVSIALQCNLALSVMIISFCVEANLDLTHCCPIPPSHHLHYSQ